MVSKKDLEREIEEVSSLQELVEIYGEIASIRMKKIRDSVLSNRDFLESIKSIFQDTLSAYSEKLSQLAIRGKLKKGERVTFLSHNGKTVAVLISANTGFYGDVVQKTLKKFLDETEKEDVEITIIGRWGRLLFREARPRTPYTFFELPDYGMDRVKMAEVIKHLVQYEEIRVYYGQYKSVVTQVPSVSKISAGTVISDEPVKAKVEYIFEPSIEDILMFFETEIFASLFDQSIREAQLAKFASRILAMDKAAQNIRERFKALNLERLKLGHNILSDKQLSLLSSCLYSIR